MPKTASPASPTTRASRLFNNIVIPEKLSEVTSYGHEDAAEAAGLSPTDVSGIWQATEKLYASKAHPMVALSLRYKGKHILNRTLGHAQGGVAADQSKLATPDTPVCLFSASKAVTAMLVHKFAEQGILDLDKPLAHYLPEFGANGKEGITVDELLRHRAGVPRVRLDRLEQVFDKALNYQQLCEAELCKKRGLKQAYHAISGGEIIDALVQRVTGESLTDWHDRWFRKPMGMTYFSYGLAQRHRQDAAHNAVAGFKLGPVSRSYFDNLLDTELEGLIDVSNTAPFQDMVMPAGNMYGTAEECSRFYQMLIDDGVYQGKQLLHPDTIARAVKGPRKASYDHTLKLPVRFSSGFMLGGAPLHLYGPKGRQGFGHIGLMNILTWADPERQLSGALLSTGKTLYGPHLYRLNRLFARINKVCPRAS